MSSPDYISGTHLCASCCCSHEPEYRQRILRRMLESDSRTPSEIADERPCFWAPNAREAARGEVASGLLFRDLRAIGARPVDGASSDSGEWELA